MGDISKSIRQLVIDYSSITYVKWAIYLILLIIAIIMALRIFRIKSLRSRGIHSEINNISEIKNRDAKIIRYNKQIRFITSLVQKTPFRLPVTDKEYMQYNINRAGLKAPGGIRYFTAEEFNAIIVLIASVLMTIAVVIAIIINAIAGIVLAVATIVCASTIPTMVLRKIVADKDREISDNFPELYLMLHYILLRGGDSPLEKTMRSYSKTTNSEEMRRFIDVCTSHIDTNGEYNATRLIANDFREIIEVGKLMRLMRQLYDGGDVRQELIGFREELLKNKKYAIERRGQRLVLMARMSFKILTIVLLQAILSAMAIYLPDMALIKGLFGGQ